MILVASFPGTLKRERYPLFHAVSSLLVSLLSAVLLFLLLLKQWFQMATALLVASLTPTLWIPGQTVFDPRSYAARIMWAASLLLVPIGADDVMTMLFESSWHWQP